MFPSPPQRRVGQSRRWNKRCLSENICLPSDWIRPKSGNPPERFEAVFAHARREGLLVVAHAGEEGPPEYVWTALDVLHARRMDHGVRAEEDPDLLIRLAEERIPLTMCPLSNVKLRVLPVSDHNPAGLLDRGLVVTINSDDPAYFGGYIGDNYVATATALKLTKAEMVALAANSFEAAFVRAEERQEPAWPNSTNTSRVTSSQSVDLATLTFWAVGGDQLLLGTDI